MSIPSINEKDTYHFPPGSIPALLAVVRPILYLQARSRKIAGHTGTDITQVYVTFCKKTVNTNGDI
jgi:hypothetical protein